jgi:hypothetical protein
MEVLMSQSQVKRLAEGLAISVGVTVAILSSLWVSVACIFFIINQIKQLF